MSDEQWSFLKTFWQQYTKKMGGLANSNAAPQLREAVVTFVCAFTGVAILGLIVEKLLGGIEGVMLIPSFGASALMVFGAPLSPYAQPRNVIGGHILSALAGVAAYQLLGSSAWLTAALAVGLAGALMHLTTTMHPPGGATALLAVIGDPHIHAQGYSYALVPVGAGAAMIVLMAVLINNLVLKRQYPTHWR